MSAYVIADFPARANRVEDMEATLRSALPDTRAFDGCISITTYFEPETKTFSLVEEWATHEHYDRYLAWRFENGLKDLLEPLIEGGAENFRPRKVALTDI